MQDDQVEAAVERVRDAALGVEDGVARLTHCYHVEASGRLAPALAPLQMAPDAPDCHDDTFPPQSAPLTRLRQRAQVDAA